MVRTVPLALLARDWRGDFATLLRAPAGYRDAGGGVAESAALAPWLAERLTRLDGGARGRSLADRVFAFQLTQGLAPDGLAGPQTLMQLNRASGVKEPQLASL